MKKYGFGVDVGGTSIKIGLFDMSGVVMKTFEIKTVTDNGGAEILDDIAAAIMTELYEEHISKTDVEGIGLGVPGPVGPDGTVYGWAPASAAASSLTVRWWQASMALAARWVT